MQHTNIAVLTFRDDVDISRYPEFRGAFDRSDPRAPVLVDLREATSVDSLFLSELLLFRRRRQPAPLAIVLAPGSYPARIAKLAELDEKLDIYLSWDEAVAALERAAAAAKP